jgi:hypothetical protein
MMSSRPLVFGEYPDLSLAHIDLDQKGAKKQRTRSGQCGLAERNPAFHRIKPASSALG